jgi:hypothetical protein
MMDSWMIDPAMMLILCIMLLGVSKSCQRHRRAAG